MYNVLFHRILAYINLLVVAILLIDSYWCPAPASQIFDHDEVAEGYMPGNGSTSLGNRVTLYNIVSTSGEKVSVPSNTDIALEAGDTFFIRYSGIFHQQLSLIYPGHNIAIKSGTFQTQAGQPRKMEVYEMGLIRRHQFGKILCTFIFGLSIINVGRRRIVKGDFINERLILGATLGMLILAIGYFW